jgi:hypothetical protein
MNENIRQKLFQYSETPPPAAWNHIADALDENGSFAQRLYDYEAQPAPGVWKNIDQQLTAPAPPVVSLRTKLFKYALAAAVLLAIAAGSVFYLNKPAAPDVAHATSKNTTSGTAKNALTDTQALSDSETILAETNSPQQDANTPANGAGATNGAVVQYERKVRIPKDQLPTGDLNVMPEEKPVMNTALQDRYIIATTQTGKVVRLPKKVYNDYVCAEAYQNYQCKERIAAIQSKMAASVATDFTSFIDLLKNLQDTQ